MINFDTANPVSVFLMVLAVLIIIGLIISVHEASHAFMANRLGDPTARLMGRMTLNPSAHIDPIGTILVPILLVIFAGFFFGWAKPTPINPLNFANPRRDSAVTAFAGPASNFAMAIAASVLYRVFPNELFFLFIVINLILGIFNLLPIPPLDGFKVLVGILPKEAALRLAVLENYGPIVLILFLLIFFQIFSGIISAILNALLFLLIGTTL
jgi:Zn-dependent protease